MKEIGGYFELELSKGIEYHSNLIKLNSGRNAFKYILKTKKPNKVYVPNYICDSVIEPLEELSITYEFYNIDKNFEILQDIKLQKNEMIFYVNYFALKSEYIRSLADKHNDKLIVDNTQAFFEKPLKNICTIYSPRKFFGVSDGGYLSSNKFLDEKLEQDESYDNSIQLLGRIDKDASSFYDDYQNAEQRLINQPIKQMSNLTQSILSSIDYEDVMKRRREKFEFLQEALRGDNALDVTVSSQTVPFAYPLHRGGYCDDLRDHLIANKIYVAKYWDEVNNREKTSDVEKEFVEQIIPLPCDQRYDLGDMKRIVNVVKEYGKMYKNQEENTRVEKFKRNSSLEEFLDEINSDLWNTEEKLLDKKEPAYPIIFIMGPMRSGSTLITQWLANLGEFSYPTNMMSRFYKSPIIASKIQRLLTDERYNYRNELRDFNSSIDFSSENGKTKGALAPNEFWYFWRRFLPFKELDYLPTKELFEKVDIDTFKSEFAGIVDVFQKPFALKGMILNYNIDFLDKVFEKAIFIHTKRDPLTNIESALKAREKQLGSVEEWYSFKIPEYEELKKLNPYEQVAGQVYSINKAVENGLENVAEHKKMTINYEDFCENPKKFYDELVSKLKSQGCEIDSEYKGEEKFDVTRKGVSDENILKVYHKFKA